MLTQLKEELAKGEDCNNFLASFIRYLTEYPDSVVIEDNQVQIPDKWADYWRFPIKGGTVDWENGRHWSDEDES